MESKIPELSGYQTLFRRATVPGHLIIGQLPKDGRGEWSCVSNYRIHPRSPMNLKVVRGKGLEPLSLSAQDL